MSAVLIAVAIVVSLGMLLLPLNRTSDVFFASPSEATQLASIEETPELNAERQIELTCSKMAQIYGLSPREFEITCYLAKGRNAKYISEKAFISEYTARTHIYNVYKKLDVHTRQEPIDLVDEHKAS